MSVGLIVGVVASYLAGSIPTSFLAGRLAGVDLRERGSKNLGATNVLRTLGWAYALPVLAVDIAKGAIPTAFFAQWVGAPGWAPALFGVVAVLGHGFSVFVGFRGGKGVATGAGALLVLAPISLSIAFGVWLLTVLLTRFVSLGSILAAVTFPFVVLARDGATEVFWMAVGLAVFVVFSHRHNIRRLLAGEELRFRGRHGASA